MAEIVIPIGLELNYTVDSGGGSQYPAWAVSTAYPAGSRVNDPAPDGDDGDYQCSWDIASSVYRPSSASGQWEGWYKIGEAPGEDKSYETTVTISDYAEWATGTALAKRQRVYDPLNNHDYEVLVAATAGENTKAPSLCVVSSNATEAARFYDLGASRAFQMFDGETEARTVSDEGDDEITVTCTAQGYSDTLAFVGMWDVDTITYSIEAGEIIANNNFDSANIAGWEAAGPCTIIYNGTVGGLQITLTGPATSGSPAEARYQAWTVPGKGYNFSAYAETGGGTGREMRLAVYGADGTGTPIATSSSRTTDGLMTVSFTATEEGQMLAVQVISGTAPDACGIKPEGTAPGDSPACSLKQSGFTPVVDEEIELAYSQGDLYRRVAKVSHDDVSYPQYTITFKAPLAFRRPEVGLVACGRAYSIGCTESDLEVGIQDFSRKERDETYGTTKFQRRGYSRQYKAKIWLASGYGDFVFEGLAARRAEPLFFDMNSASTDLARLMTWGYSRDWHVITTGMPNNEVLVIDVEGLIE